MKSGDLRGYASSCLINLKCSKFSTIRYLLTLISNRPLPAALHFHFKSSYTHIYKYMLLWMCLFVFVHVYLLLHGWVFWKICWQKHEIIHIHIQFISNSIWCSWQWFECSFSAYKYTYTRQLAFSLTLMSFLPNKFKLH